MLNMAYKVYIHQHENWHLFRYSKDYLDYPYSSVRFLQGRLLGKMEAIGFRLQSEAILSTITTDVLKSTEIEGENLKKIEVRSSVARRLGLSVAGMVKSSYNVDGVVDMMLNATEQYDKPLTQERLFAWHNLLFPVNRSGNYRIEVGQYRSGEMQVISGAMGKEKIHYKAPKPEYLPSEMEKFLNWVNTDNNIDLVLKAAIAHFWFVTIHPFDDGNGRIARAISDMLLARSEGSSKRFYSMSNQILNERKQYYKVLEKTQKGSGDITNWILWFLKCLEQAVLSSDILLETTLSKANFWKKHAQTKFNDRQLIMLNKLFDGFQGKLNSSKWAKITKCSRDTALNDIKDLIVKDVLKQEEGGGRSVNYSLKL